MHFASVPAALVAFATVVSAVTHQVMVGQSGLAFNPSSVNASQGDMVQFIFYPKNHTVTQSTFAAPCQAMANGVDSSFQPVAAGASANPSMTIPVNSTDPVWFYCRQATHCQQGMVFAINPTANKSFEAFQAAAKGSSSSSTSATGGASPATSAGAAPSSSQSSSSGKGGNGAVATGVRAGSLLAVIGVVAGILL